MILFLNFAPISFMGGAEKWMNETAKKIAPYENTQLVSVSESLASIYSSLVLKRKFNSRINQKEIHKHISLHFWSFIPFTSEWQNVRSFFQKSRIIYFRYELPEFLILFYFGGKAGLKKAIAGLHSPFLYLETNTFFEKLHNTIYSSSFSRKVLASLQKIHVLNKRDFSLLSNDYQLSNASYVPNGMETQSKASTIQSDNKLHILYVGELSTRKGTDRLIQVIKNSPRSFLFTIAGDGPLQPEILSLVQQNEQCIYRGFLNKKELADLYQTNEVLFLPSRAESMPLSVLEALSYGLTIVNSAETSLQLPNNIEYSSIDNTPSSYIKIFKRIYFDKKNKQLKPNANKRYFDKNLSTQKVMPQLYRNVFQLSL